MGVVHFKTVEKHVRKAERELRSLGDKAPEIPRDQKNSGRNRKAGRPEFDRRYVLIDYRNNNEHLEKRFLKPSKAEEWNVLLEGTGLAYAKIGR